jgi:hypothetical protein
VSSPDARRARSLDGQRGGRQQRDRDQRQAPRHHPHAFTGVAGRLVITRPTDPGLRGAGVLAALNVSRGRVDLWSVSGSTHDEVRAWLHERPSLSDLRAAYPREWATVQRDLAPILADGDLEALKSYVLKLDGVSIAGRARAGRDAALSRLVRRQIASATLTQVALSAAAGTTRGRTRFNLLNGYVAQRLLFAKGLERKPVSMFWFSACWPLLWQRKRLMPLVGPKGIYCFYSRRLIGRLAAMIGDRSCLEVAAGDGTLSRFLTAAGVRVTATDDHSWTHSVQFPDTVIRQDARAALREHHPQVVICSWPPAGNDFERDVFATPSVQLYIVIASQHDFASGNRLAYDQQPDFSFTQDDALTRLVLPPELESAVYVFTRRDVS